MSYNLIVQSLQPVAAVTLTELTRLSGSNTPPQQTADHVFRWQAVNPPQRHALATYCDNAALDWALIKSGKRLTDIGLVVMDMDSTLITIECIDEIADLYGLKSEIAAITERAMRGELDFAASLRERVALLAGLEESALARVYDERLQLSDGAERMLQALHAAGAQSLLVSGGFTYFTERLQKRLNLSKTVANVLDIHNGKLTGKVVGDIIDAQAKANWLLAMREQQHLRPEQVIALGDGANDLKMLAVAGIGIAYHAKPIVRAQTHFSLSHVGLDGLLAWFDA